MPAMIANNILGIHTARRGFKDPLIANCEENCIKKMYIKLNPRPAPIFAPIPPLIFLEESETPIKVRIKVENGIASLLYLSSK